MPSPSPAVFATTPFAPSAPTRTRALTDRPPTVAVISAGPIQTSSTRVPSLNAQRGCLLGEKGVEPTALRHQDQRLGARAPEAAPVVEAQLERVDDPLDDRGDVARCLLQCSPRDAAAAGLVAREARPVGEEHAQAAAGEVDRGRRPGRPGTGDQHVVALHHGSVGGLTSVITGRNRAPALTLRGFPTYTAERRRGLHPAGTTVRIMQGRGFEPLKAEPAGLQPAPFGHSGTPARLRSVAAPAQEESRVHSRSCPLSSVGRAPPW
jgi:hypothetical protein